MCDGRQHPEGPEGLGFRGRSDDGSPESYLETLAEQAHQNLPEDELTKAEASELIDKLRQKAGLEQ